MVVKGTLAVYFSCGKKQIKINFFGISSQHAGVRDIQPSENAPLFPTLRHGGGKNDNCGKKSSVNKVV